MTRVLVTTVRTRDNKGLQLLYDSAARFQIPVYTSQGTGLWKNFYTNKIERFIPEVMQQDWEVLLYCDCNDVFFTCEDAVERSLEALRKSGKGLLVSGEGNCWPWPERYARLFTSKRRHRFPNAGVWIGERQAIQNAYTLMEQASRHTTDYSENGRTRANDDQLHWTELVLDGHARVEESEKWCLNLYQMSDSEVQGIPHLETIPTIVHGSSWENKPRVARLYREMFR